MTALDWIFVVIYFAMLALIGVQTSRRVKNMDDFAIAGEKIVWPVMFATLAASFLGGGASIGIAGNIANDGYVFLFAFFGFSIQFVLLGYFVAPRLKDYKGAQTIGDIMEHHYGRKTKLLTGILSICLCAGILGAQALAIGTIFNMVLNIPPAAGIIIGMGLVILYSTIGGIWAVIQTDVIQFIVLGILLPVTLLIGLSQTGGPIGLVEEVPASFFTFFGEWEVIAFVSLFVTFLLGEALVPPYAQRAFCTKDSNHARKGYLISGIFSFGFYFIAATLGLIAYIVFPGIPSDQALPAIVQNLLPMGITGLAVAALLAVIMSTADSYLNSTSVSFMRDIYTPFLKPNSRTNDNKLLLLSRIVTLVVGVTAVIFALSAPSIIDALMYAYSLWAPTVVVPLIIASVGKVYSKNAGFYAIIVGGIVTSVWIWGLNEPWGIAGLVPGVTANIITFFVIYIFEKTFPAKNIELAHTSLNEEKEG
ncbi:sodium:solute symporter [Alteribacillus sp. YIM 98480]|uniref:sodium:solute symporter family protein n=1 Tax=Alteribacillus sp. YIM 98480 TaxID=2606599 RepID=UPI00131A9DC5|nr:sodium:solute symporter family protein [Alteribacillus sp. YIM 98480]